MLVKPSDVADLEISTGALAKLLGISQQRVHQLVGEQVIARCGPGRFKAEAITRYAESQRAKAVTASTGGTSYAEQRTRLATIKADREERLEMERRGELVNWREIVEFWGPQIAAAKTQLRSAPAAVLRAVPDVSKRALAAMTREIDRALDEVSEEWKRVATSNVKQQRSRKKGAGRSRRRVGATA